MGCGKIRSIIPKYVEHSATEEEINIVEEHLCICEECRQYLKNILNKEESLPETSDANNVSFNAENKNKQKIDIFTVLILGISIIAVFISLWLFFKSH